MIFKPTISAYWEIPLEGNTTIFLFWPYDWKTEIRIRSKGHDAQIKKNTYKNAYLGSIFIPEKYVFGVCFESPFMRMISAWNTSAPPPY